jgi:hypothetical protein
MNIGKFLCQKNFFYGCSLLVAFFAPWFFVIYCFLYAFKNIDLTATKLGFVFLMAIGSGIPLACIMNALAFSRNNRS